MNNMPIFIFYGNDQVVQFWKFRIPWDNGVVTSLFRNHRVSIYCLFHNFLAYFLSLQRLQLRRYPVAVCNVGCKYIYLKTSICPGIDCYMIDIIDGHYLQVDGAIDTAELPEISPSLGKVNRCIGRLFANGNFKQVI